jgi:putative membrane protein
MPRDEEYSYAHNRYLLLLSLLFVLEFILLAFTPYDRHDWILENVLVLLAVLFFATTHNAFPLSRISLTLIFLFLALHEVGAHYTYSQVPYEAWGQSLFGISLNGLFGWERNNFDRVVHFLYGLLLAYPLREFFLRVVDVKGFWGYFFPLLVTMASSMLYELVEWGAAVYFGGDLGIAYLGTQGDVWDAHKDMLLATIGALLAMLLTAAINAALQKDFGREWMHSFRVKHKLPLGENALMRLWRQRRRK